MLSGVYSERGYVGVIGPSKWPSRLNMDNQFFERPILNSPYDYPTQYWELDEQGQPTQWIIESGRRAEFITPIPKPQKRKATTMAA